MDFLLFKVNLGGLFQRLSFLAGCKNLFVFHFSAASGPIRLFTPYKRRRKIQSEHQQAPQQQIQAQQPQVQQSPVQQQVQQLQEQTTTTINVIAANSNSITTNSINTNSINNNSTTAQNNNITVTQVNNNNSITANNNATTNHSPSAKKKRVNASILNQFIKQCDSSDIETDISFNVKEETWQNITEGVELSNEYVDQQCKFFPMVF